MSLSKSQKVSNKIYKLLRHTSFFFYKVPTVYISGLNVQNVLLLYFSVYQITVNLKCTFNLKKSQDILLLIYFIFGIDSIRQVGPIIGKPFDPYLSVLLCRLIRYIFTLLLKEPELKAKGNTQAGSAFHICGILLNVRQRK